MHIRRAVPALIVSAAVFVLAAPAFAAGSANEQLAFNTESPIVVTEWRATDDDAINQKVVDTLANDASLAGKIGVQTTDRQVELTGIVTGPRMYRQAERDAMSVYGVRNVHNRLAMRMGGGRY